MKRSLIFTALAVTLTAQAALAEDVWVKSEFVEIRSGKGAIFPVLAKASKGAQLTVAAREGKWIKVKVGDKDGYVFEDQLSTQKVDGGGNILAGMTNTANMNTSSAGKGLRDDAESYAQTRNMDSRPLNWLIWFSHSSIKPEEWQSFVAEGKVGPDARR